MSKGPGRWERLLLHELYHTDLQPSRIFGRRLIYVRAYATTPSETSAVYRAARALHAKGWAIGGEYCSKLEPCDQPPPVAADRCPLCVSVHKSSTRDDFENTYPIIGADGKVYKRSQVWAFASPDNT